MISKGITCGFFSEAVKAQLELRFARDLKGNKKNFYYNFKSKKKRSVLLCSLNGANSLVTMEANKVVIPRPIFASDLLSESPSILSLRFKEENCQQWVRIEPGIMGLDP